jgi:hypothetical protein
MENLNLFFKPPIFYNHAKQALSPDIIRDLELVQTVDPSNQPIYAYGFNLYTKDVINVKAMEQLTKYYTTDVQFIKDNQKLLKQMKFSKKKEDKDEDKDKDKDKDNKNNSTDLKKIIEVWREIKEDTGFKEKYHYVDWDCLEFLNTNEYFLQFMSIYSMTSPIITLILPLFILLIPFLIIKTKGIDLSFDEYLSILKECIQHNAIGRLFTQFHTVSLQEKTYMIVSALFYVFSIYQNFLLCYKFNQNMKKIHEFINEFKIYLQHTILSMEDYVECTKCFSTHEEFLSDFTKELDTLKEIQTELLKITDFKYNFNKFSQIGHILKTFYQLHTNKTFEHCIMYSFGFHGYMDCLKGLQENIREKKMNFSQFTKKKNKNIFKNIYYPTLKDVSHVKNDVNLNKHIIISGPNASGKTTIVKSTLFNIICTQQFGCGFYDSAILKPYHHLHCYLNIPDTSGRDSLFQAEARRCKNIIDFVVEHNEDMHFCAFDELYSGTNPEEATSSAIAFMKYIVKRKNVCSMLTTHFIEVCNSLDSHENIVNCHMHTKKDKHNIRYFFQLREGISNVKGGYNVLHELNYPKEIIENMKT